MTPPPRHRTLRRVDVYFSCLHPSSSNRQCRHAHAESPNQDTNTDSDMHRHKIQAKSEKWQVFWQATSHNIAWQETCRFSQNSETAKEGGVRRKRQSRRDLLQSPTPTSNAAPSKRNVKITRLLPTMRSNYSVLLAKIRPKKQHPIFNETSNGVRYQLNHGCPAAGLPAAGALFHDFLTILSCCWACWKSITDCASEWILTHFHENHHLDVYRKCVSPFSPWFKFFPVNNCLISC